jgi:translin
MSYLNKKIFTSIKSDIENYDSKREKIIIESRRVLKESKLLIYSIQRDDLKSADNIKKSLTKLKNNFQKLTLKNNLLEKEGSYKAASQEYVEAILFYEFVKNRKIPSHIELNVNGEDYLLGLCDLTGELGRLAVIKATNKNFDDVKEIKNLTEDIFGEFLKLNPRNGELRKKSDSIKWNLKKIEELLYDCSK